MTISNVVFLAIFAILWWGYCGYYFYLQALKLIKIRRQKFSPGNKTDLPSMSIIVATMNEESCIAEKIENLAQLEYPTRLLEVLIVDGGSADQTLSLIRQGIIHYPWMRLVETRLKGKIAQLNHVLPSIQSEIIINTDADAILKPDVLERFAETFQHNPNVAVVGAWVQPLLGCPEELQYVLTLNEIKSLETMARSSSIVIASCYGWRREIIDQFPIDVIADDIYLPFKANSMGLEVNYLTSAIVWDRRSPGGLRVLLRHKFRKAHAYMIEIRRFSKESWKGRNIHWAIMLGSIYLQLFVQPWLLILSCLSSLYLIFHGSVSIVSVCALIAAGSLWVAHRFVATTANNPLAMRDNFFLGVKMFFVTSGLLMISGLCYPFYEQSSNYQRLEEKTKHGRIPTVI